MSKTDTSTQPPTSECADVAVRVDRKPYQKPHLIDFGDVRESTMGASPGIGDSANPALLRP